MKKLLTIALVALAATAHAQQQEAPQDLQQEATQSQQQDSKKTTIQVPEWVNNIKFSGYGILQYQGTDKRGAKSNSFNLRLLRLILDGKIGDFAWRAQIQGTNVKGSGEPTVQLRDLYGEWQKYKEIRVRAGQFKRGFTFDNPTHPITQGWRNYADVVYNLVGFTDRAGEKNSGGRDIGIQVQGDLFPASDGHRYLHYQFGIFNGEGINTRDKDNRKDLIGGIWVCPVKGLRIGAFGWLGSHGEMVKGVDFYGNNIIGSVPLNRYALSAEWDKDQWLFRTEYVHSQGWGVAANQIGKGSNVIDYGQGEKADGWYAMAQVPVIKSKLHAKARYQVYRQKKDWQTSVTQYEAGVNYFFTPKLQVNLEYAFVYDRTLTRRNYNLFDLEVAFQF